MEKGKKKRARGCVSGGSTTLAREKVGKLRVAAGLKRNV
jgi:hypothetical protein